MGLYAKSAPVEVDDRGVAVGRIPGRGGQARGHPRQGLLVAPHLRRQPDPHAKATGQYLNSILAKTEAAKAGYDEAILLDQRGFVCEGSGENMFMVRDGVLVTPRHTSSILDGITRKSVIQIAADLGYTVEERDIARVELYAGGRGLPHRHGGRARAGARDRRPSARRARRGHPLHPGEVRGRPARAGSGVPRVAGHVEQPSKVTSSWSLPRNRANYGRRSRLAARGRAGRRFRATGGSSEAAVHHQRRKDHP